MKHRRDRMGLGLLWIALALLALPVRGQDSGQVERGPFVVPESLKPQTSQVVCKDSYVYLELCGKDASGEKVCTLAPLTRFEDGARVRGCNDMTVLGTMALLAAAHGAGLASTDVGAEHGLAE